MYYFYRLIDNEENKEYESRGIQGIIVKKEWTEYKYKITKLDSYINKLVECEIDSKSRPKEKKKQEEKKRKNKKKKGA